jgi:uncharacterized protein (TIGR02145 family)
MKINKYKYQILKISFTALIHLFILLFIIIRNNKSFLKVLMLSLCLGHYSLFTIPCFSQGVSINTNGMPADASAILDVSSSSQGLLIPRMTTTQRNSINSPALSLLIFNTTTNCFEAYVNGSWYSVSCPPACMPPSIPTARINTPAQTQIAWNWNTVSGATGYKFNTANNYSTAIDNGANNSYSQTGLACNTAYSLYVWAYNSCGNSSYTVLEQTTSSCICTIAACGSQVFMCTNLDVGTQIQESQSQTANTKWCYGDIPANCTTYGGQYQWSTAMTIAKSYNTVYATATVGIANETCNPCGPTTGKGGVQGICPAGFHIPSDLEWSQYAYCLDVQLSPVDTDPSTNKLSDFQTIYGYRGSAAAGIGPGDKMKVTSGNNPAWDGTNTSGFTALPAGWINNGNTYGLGSYTYMWTTTEDSEVYAWFSGLYTGKSQSVRIYEWKYNGSSVRCLQD